MTGLDHKFLEGEQYRREFEIRAAKEQFVYDQLRR